MLKQNKNTLYKEISKCPSVILMAFVLSSVLMNFFANKEVSFPINGLALDCGVICSGITFLCMDVIIKLFGLKYANKILVFTTICSLCVSILFYIVGIIPGYWGKSLEASDVASVNIAINETLKGNWFILLGSTIAFVISGYVNNFLNQLIAVRIKDNGLKFSKFATRSYISTLIGQIVDNLIFSVIVSRTLFGWGAVECLTCSILTAIIEMFFEIVLSPIGFFIVKAEKS